MEGNVSQSDGQRRACGLDPSRTRAAVPALPSRYPHSRWRLLRLCPRCCRSGPLSGVHRTCSPASFPLLLPCCLRQRPAPWCGTKDSRSACLTLDDLAARSSWEPLPSPLLSPSAVAGISVHPASVAVPCTLSFFFFFLKTKIVFLKFIYFNVYF